MHATTLRVLLIPRSTRIEYFGFHVLEIPERCLADHYNKYQEQIWARQRTDT